MFVDYEIFKEGQTGTLKFKDGTTAKVIVHRFQTFPCTGLEPTVYLKYQEGETNQQIKPPYADVLPIPYRFMTKDFFIKD